MPSPVGREEEKGPAESTFQAPSAPTPRKALQAILSGVSRESGQGPSRGFYADALCTARPTGSLGQQASGFLEGQGPAPVR